MNCSEKIVFRFDYNVLDTTNSSSVSCSHIILLPLSSSGLFIIRVELTEELVIEVNVNMSVELQSLTLIEVPTSC